VDVGLLRELRAKGYGFKRIAGEYTKATGEYISHTTVRERLVVISTQPGNVVATVFAESLERSYPWAVGFFFGNTELSLELWNIISGISGFDD